MKPPLRRGLGFFVLGALVGWSACGVPDLAERQCPPEGTALTYSTFGKGLFDRHCVQCHGGVDGVSSRAFNTLALIQAQRERIYANSVGENPPMPPGPIDPTSDERDKLAEWLACGAPE